LGTVAGAVVHGESGLDEVAGDAPTRVTQFDRAGIRRWTLVPSDYGIAAARGDLRGGDAAENARILLAILDGERSPRADVVCVNAALALMVAGEAVDIADGLARARASIERGAARAALDALRGAHEMEYA
jgi:anthranilate phosphoribosyltransferase